MFGSILLLTGFVFLLLGPVLSFRSIVLVSLIELYLVSLIDIIGILLPSHHGHDIIIMRLLLRLDVIIIFVLDLGGVVIPSLEGTHSIALKVMLTIDALDLDESGQEDEGGPCQRSGLRAWHGLMNLFVVVLLLEEYSPR